MKNQNSKIRSQKYKAKIIMAVMLNLFQHLGIVIASVSEAISTQIAASPPAPRNDVPSYKVLVCSFDFCVMTFKFMQI